MVGTKRQRVARFAFIVRAIVNSSDIALVAALMIKNLFDYVWRDA
jgi:hypothetical protein